MGGGLFLRGMMFVVVVLCCMFVVVVDSATSAPSLEPTAPLHFDNVVYDLRKEEEMQHTWLEIGFTFLNDQEWTVVETKEDEMNPLNDTNIAVFISLPEYGGDEFDEGFPLVPKLQGRATKLPDGKYTFSAKLVQANDTQCSKEWFIPQPISEVQVSWMLAEEGVYNFSEHLFIINSDNITRNNSVEVPNDYPLLAHHVEIFDYPHAAGCNSTANSPCSYTAFAQNVSNIRHLGAIQQIQTNNNVKEEGKDLWLTIRARSIRDSYSEFVIITHNANRTLFPDYESIHIPEEFAYFIFETSLDFVCLENLMFETKADFDVSSVGVKIDFIFDYAYPPGLYGMLGTIRSLTDSTSLRAYNRSKTTTNYITQEDQCLKENQKHTAKENTYSMVTGEAESFDGLDHAITRCFMRFSSGWIPTGMPTGPPSSEPSSKPSLPPSSEPSGHPTISPSSVPSLPPSEIPSGAPTRPPSGEPTTTPSASPSFSPSRTPTHSPSGEPSGEPSSEPSGVPSASPSGEPSRYPSGAPSVEPSGSPSSIPSSVPSTVPTLLPSSSPSGAPSISPITIPTSFPSGVPSGNPSVAPSAQPSVQPTPSPSGMPSCCPVSLPSGVPSQVPLEAPTGSPTVEPTSMPTGIPLGIPTTSPSDLPTLSPTFMPSLSPSGLPSMIPSGIPTTEPTVDPTAAPSSNPSELPTANPTLAPSAAPSAGPTLIPSTTPSTSPSRRPTHSPSGEPSGVPSATPSDEPSPRPSGEPSGEPSGNPSFVPSSVPSQVPTSSPSGAPSGAPSGEPTTAPSFFPSVIPSGGPTTSPSIAPSGAPSGKPSTIPSCTPSGMPSGGPTSSPSGEPSGAPSAIPSNDPTGIPSLRPSGVPNSDPSVQPTAQPSLNPTGVPSQGPTSSPSGMPTQVPQASPTRCPTSDPTSEPTGEPTGMPTSEPSVFPTIMPSSSPSWRPSVIPSPVPSAEPTTKPSTAPSGNPSGTPSGVPSNVPSGLPTTFPTGRPSSAPSSWPSGEPSTVPSCTPSTIPSAVPSSSPTSRPSSVPSGLPSTFPTGRPSSTPSSWPSGEPSAVPSCTPSTIPSAVPSSSPTSRPSAYPTNAPTNSDMFYSRSPLFHQLACRPSSDGTQSVIVDYEIKEQGRISCASFEGDAIPVLNTVHAISASVADGGGNTSVHFTAPDTGSMILNGLKGDVTYQVLCYSESFVNFPGVVTSTELFNVYNMSCNATAPSPKSAVLKVLDTDDGSGATVVRGGVSNLMEVSVSSLPSKKVIFTPVAFSYPYDSSLGKVRCIPPLVTSMDMSDQDYSIQFAPSSFTFESNSTNLIQRFYFNSTTEAECLFMTLLKSEVSRDEFVTTTVSPHGLHNVSVGDGSEVFQQNFVSFFVSDRDDSSFEFDEPIVFSADVDTSGSKVVLEYNYETDRAHRFNLSAGEFNCSELISSAWASASKCEFTSMRHVTITFPADDDEVSLPLVGDEIDMTGGKVRSKCHKDPAVCSGTQMFYPVERAATVVINPPPANLPAVVPTILSSHILTSCDEGLAINIYTSTGHGGRNWRNISWSVIGPDNDSTTTMPMVDYLNSQVDWVRCGFQKSLCKDIPVLPSHLFPGYGRFTLILYLENWLGNSAHGTFTVDFFLSNNTVPDIQLLDGSQRVANTWQSQTSHVLLNIRRSENCTGMEPDELLNLSYSWEVIRNIDGSETTSPLVNEARDERKFITRASEMLPESEYSFLFSVSRNDSSNPVGSSYDGGPLVETRVYVSKGSTVARINAGKVKSIFPGEDLKLDASNSFDEGVPLLTGAAAELVFEWSCFVISPVLSHLCPGFVPGNSPQFLIDANDVRNDTLYSIVLDVTDRDGLRHSSARVKVQSTSHSPASVTLPSIIAVESLSNYVFDIASVVRPLADDNSAFSVTWSIDELETTAIQKTVSFLRPGPIVSEYLLLLSSVSSGAKYSLSMSIDSSPDCVSNCLGGKFSLAVITNFPPSGGSFTVYPSIGDSSLTEFSLSARSWVDADMPLQFSFLQSTSCDLDVHHLLQQKSPLSWTFVTLREGCANDSFETVTQVKVSDAYGSTTSLHSDPIVVRRYAVQSWQYIWATKLMVSSHELNTDKKFQLLNFPLTGVSNESVVAEYVVSSMSLIGDIAASVEYDFDAFVSLAQSFSESVSLLQQNEISHTYLVDQVMLGTLIESVNALSTFASNTDTSGFDLLTKNPNTIFLVGLSELYTLYRTVSQSSTRRHLGENSRSLQGILDTLDTLLSGVETAASDINEILFHQLPIGESSVQEYGGFDIWSRKVLFSELATDSFRVSTSDNITITDLLTETSPTASAISFGLYSILFKDASVSACVENSLTSCEVKDNSLKSAAYIDVLTTTGWSQSSEFSVQSDLPAVDMPGKRSASSYSKECLASLTPTVYFDCSMDTMWGAKFSRAMSCVNNETSDYMYGTWEMTCPVYNTSVTCSSDTSSSCRAVTVSPGITACSCNSNFGVTASDTGSTGVVVSAAGYTKFQMEVSSAVAYEVDVVENPSFVYSSPQPSIVPSGAPTGVPITKPTSSPSAWPTSLPSTATVELESISIVTGSTWIWIMLLIVLLLLLLLLIFFCCVLCKKEKYWLPWLEVNTDPHWVLRELVDETHCSFDDNDFVEFLHELDQPFDDDFNTEVIALEKKNLARNYPIRNVKCVSWQELNVNPDLSHLDGVNRDEDFDGDDIESDELQLVELAHGCGERVVSYENDFDELAVEDMEDWGDMNDSFHDMLFRDDVTMEVIVETYGDALEDLCVELEKELTIEKDNSVVLHSGLLLLKNGGATAVDSDEGDAGVWERCFFEVVTQANDKNMINFYDKKGILRGNIPCDHSQVVSSREDKHGFMITNPLENGLLWRMKADSPESQYEWVQIFSKVCSEDRSGHSSENSVNTTLVDDKAT